MATLKDAYSNFDIWQTLQPNDKLLCEEVFEPLSRSLLNQLTLEKGKNTKIMLFGHTGCGKSTFLNHLTANPGVTDNYFPIKYSINDILNPEDITHVDLLLSIGLHAFEQAFPDPGYLLDPTKAELIDLANLLAGRTVIEEIKNQGFKAAGETETSFGFPAILNFFSATFKGSFKAEKDFRKKTRERIHGKTQDLIRIINGILSDIMIVKKKPVLLLVDDTDKLLTAQSQEIFQKNGEYFANINATLLLVINMDVACCQHFPQILNKIRGCAEMFPAMKIYDKTGTASIDTQKYREMMKKVYEKRIDMDLLDPGVLDDLIKLSGGIVREAVRLANYAVLKGVSNGVAKLGVNEANSAMMRRRNEHNLTQEKMKILKNVLDDATWMPSEAEAVDSPDSPFLVLINSLALIEYRNAEDKWRRPHPVLIGLIKEKTP